MIASVLQSIDGGRVLDVATQEGRFVQILMDNLQDFSEIVGVDTSELAIERAREALGQENIQFLVMNAERLDFEDSSFDTVSISASLHHLENIRQVLGEMKRVLKPNGHFIIAEMHRDAQTEAELTSVRLHHWAAEVDRALGHPHNSTLARQEIEEYVAGLDLSDVAWYDDDDRDSDPMEVERIELLKNVIERYIQRVEGVDQTKALQRQGEKLRHRLDQVGAQREPILMIVGKK